MVLYRLRGCVALMGDLTKPSIDYILEHDILEVPSRKWQQIPKGFCVYMDDCKSIEANPLVSLFSRWRQSSFYFK